MSFWNRPLTEDQIAFCVIGFGVFFTLPILRAVYEFFAPKKIIAPRLYWKDGEWYTDGSREMLELAFKIARPGERISLPPGTHTFDAINPIPVSKEQL